MTADSAPGVQNERTALAWQRTALSLMAGSVALTRLTFDRLGLVSLASVVVTVPLCLWVLSHSRRRYQRRAAASTAAAASGHGAVASAALMLSVVAMAATELAALFSG